MIYIYIYIKYDWPSLGYGLVQTLTKYLRQSGLKIFDLS